MRVLRMTPLIIAALATTFFLACYARTVRELLDAGMEAHGASFPRVCYELRNDIAVIVWKPFPGRESWGDRGWDLFWYGDAPEGTIPIVYFPSWYLLIPLVALWVYGFVIICDQDGDQ